MGKNAGIFQTAKRLESTTHMFFGHDHKNILCYEYQGINFVYGLKTGISAYHDTDRIGTTLITLQNDMNIKVEYRFAN